MACVLPVKKKLIRKRKNAEDIAKGIVKWLVDVYDETGETVAIATILTMVKKEESGVNLEFVHFVK